MINVKSISSTAKRGFTLLEILMVLTLLGIVLSIVGKKVFSGFGQGQVRAAKIAIKQLEGNLDLYKLDCNRYPTTEQTLKALIEAPSGAPECKNYNTAGYLDGAKKLPKDPWDTEFVYTSDGITYTIKSLGADGKEGGDGNNKDISSEDE